MTLRFVTGNPGKVDEVADRLEVHIEQVDYDYVEIQADTLEAVALSGVTDAFEALGGDIPVIVEDSGLFIDCLDGFPGPYSAYVEETLGIDRVWHLVEAESNRHAYFESVVAYTDGELTRAFHGRVDGTICAPRGTGGFGYDPIFEVAGRTMAERSTSEKNELSHRGAAIDRFAEWYASQS